MSKPRVKVLRGHHTNVWDLRVLAALEDRFEFEALVTGSTVNDLAGLELPSTNVRTPRDLLPAGRLAGGAAYALGERYLGLEKALRGSDVVHTAEIGTWFTAQAAALKPKLGFRLVATVWETLPWRRTYRWPRERRYRERSLEAIDLFLATTERARDCLLVEGVPEDRILVCPPGIAPDRFAAGERGGEPPSRHLVLSAARLVWEKGHQDVLRAFALLQRERDDVDLLILGSGPERGKLEAYAAELGVRCRFEATVPYDRMPSVYAEASALVLASLPVPAWEEQFGMVLVEARAAGLQVLASTSGAIPEVLGSEGSLFAPGDWPSIARLLAEGPLAAAPATRHPAEAAWLAQYSVETAAGRTAAAYERVLRD